eukprot:Nk52_evm55s153 gene=Nk52_evmTU55s153
MRCFLFRLSVVLIECVAMLSLLQGAPVQDYIGSDTVSPAILEMADLVGYNPSNTYYQDRPAEMSVNQKMVENIINKADTTPKAEEVERQMIHNKLITQALSFIESLKFPFRDPKGPFNSYTDLAKAEEEQEVIEKSEEKQKEVDKARAQHTQLMRTAPVIVEAIITATAINDLIGYDQPLANELQNHCSKTIAEIESLKSPKNESGSSTLPKGLRDMRMYPNGLNYRQEWDALENNLRIIMRVLHIHMHPFSEQAPLGNPLWSATLGEGNYGGEDDKLITSGLYWPSDGSIPGYDKGESKRLGDEENRLMIVELINQLRRAGISTASSSGRSKRDDMTSSQEKSNPQSSLTSNLLTAFENFEKTAEKMKTLNKYGSSDQNELFISPFVLSLRQLYIDLFRFQAKYENTKFPNSDPLTAKGLAEERQFNKKLYDQGMIDRFMLVLKESISLANNLFFSLSSFKELNLNTLCPPDLPIPHENSTLRILNGIPQWIPVKEVTREMKLEDERQIEAFKKEEVAFQERIANGELAGRRRRQQDSSEIPAVLDDVSTEDAPNPSRQPGEEVYQSTTAKHELPSWYSILDVPLKDMLTTLSCTRSSANGDDSVQYRVRYLDDARDSVEKFAQCMMSYEEILRNRHEGQIRNRCITVSEHWTSCNATCSQQGVRVVTIDREPKLANDFLKCSSQQSSQPCSISCELDPFCEIPSNNDLIGCTECVLKECKACKSLTADSSSKLYMYENKKCLPCLGVGSLPMNGLYCECDETYGWKYKETIDRSDAKGTMTCRCEVSSASPCFRPSYKDYSVKGCETYESDPQLKDAVRCLQCKEAEHALVENGKSCSLCEGHGMIKNIDTNPWTCKCDNTIGWEWHIATKRCRCSPKDGASCGLKLNQVQDCLQFENDPEQRGESSVRCLKCVKGKMLSDNGKYCTICNPLEEQNRDSHMRNRTDKFGRNVCFCDKYRGWVWGSEPDENTSQPVCVCESKHPRKGLCSCKDGLSLDIKGRCRSKCMCGGMFNNQPLVGGSCVPQEDQTALGKPGACLKCADIIGGPSPNIPNKQGLCQATCSGNDVLVRTSTLNGALMCLPSEFSLTKNDMKSPSSFAMVGEFPDMSALLIPESMGEKSEAKRQRLLDIQCGGKVSIGLFTERQMRRMKDGYISRVKEEAIVEIQIQIQESKNGDPVTRIVDTSYTPTNPLEKEDNGKTTPGYQLFYGAPRLFKVIVIKNEGKRTQTVQLFGNYFKDNAVENDLDNEYEKIVEATFNRKGPEDDLLYLGFTRLGSDLDSNIKVKCKGRQCQAGAPIETMSLKDFIKEHDPKHSSLVCNIRVWAQSYVCTCGGEINRVVDGLKYYIPGGQCNSDRTCKQCPKNFKISVNHCKTRCEEKDEEGLVTSYFDPFSSECVPCMCAIDFDKEKTGQNGYPVMKSAPGGKCKYDTGACHCDENIPGAGVGNLTVKQTMAQYGLRVNINGEMKLCDTIYERKGANNRECRIDLRDTSETSGKCEKASSHLFPGNCMCGGMIEGAPEKGGACYQNVCTRCGAGDGKGDYSSEYYRAASDASVCSKKCECGGTFNGVKIEGGSCSVDGICTACPNFILEDKPVLSTGERFVKCGGCSEGGKVGAEIVSPDGTSSKVTCKKESKLGTGQYETTPDSRILSLRTESGDLRKKMVVFDVKCAGSVRAILYQFMKAKDKENEVGTFIVVDIGTGQNRYTTIRACNWQPPSDTTDTTIEQFFANEKAYGNCGSVLNTKTQDTPFVLFHYAKRVFKIELESKDRIGRKTFIVRVFKDGEREPFTSAEVTGEDYNVDNLYRAAEAQLLFLGDVESRKDNYMVYEKLDKFIRGTVRSYFEWNDVVSTDSLDCEAKEILSTCLCSGSLNAPCDPNDPHCEGSISIPQPGGKCSSQAGVCAECPEGYYRNPTNGGTSCIPCTCFVTPTMQNAPYSLGSSRWTFQPRVGGSTDVVKNYQRILRPSPGGLCDQTNGYCYCDRSFAMKSDELAPKFILNDLSNPGHRLQLFYDGVPKATCEYTYESNDRAPTECRVRYLATNVKGSPEASRYCCRYNEYLFFNFFGNSDPNSLSHMPETISYRPETPDDPNFRNCF